METHEVSGIDSILDGGLLGPQGACSLPETCIGFAFHFSQSRYGQPFQGIFFFFFLFFYDPSFFYYFLRRFLQWAFLCPIFFLHNDFPLFFSTPFSTFFPQTLFLSLRKSKYSKISISTVNHLFIDFYFFSFEKK